MTKWLHAHSFSYKKPAPTPAKADPEQQKAFIDLYKKLLEEIPAEEPIEFGDGVHPTMATKIAYGWIRTGKDKPIYTTASRTRINLFGSINLKTMNLTIAEYKTIDSDAICDYFKFLRTKYPGHHKIHLILDQGPYHKSEKTRQEAEKLNIKIHFLPAYSPNLNPIERLWKVMNEHVRNNVFFASSKLFKEKIMEFFNHTWPQISSNMKGRINDHFRVVKTESSS